MDALSIPLGKHTAATAKAALKALPAYKSAIAKFNAGEVAFNNDTIRVGGCLPHIRIYIRTGIENA